MYEETAKAIHQYKIIVIIRGVQAAYIKSLANALYKGGIRLIEVTFNQKNGSNGITETAECIKIIKESTDGHIHVGAGTVLTARQLHAAASAGAEYIVSPNVDIDVIKETKKLGLISIPGALTPTEIITAHKAGADFVKLFPAGDLGLGYIKSIIAPINHIPMLAVGGVDEKNISDFLNAGLCGVGVGSNIIPKNLVENGRFDEITELAKVYVAAAVPVRI